MLKGLPWDTLGPAAAAAVVILVIVFWFILKWQKATKPAALPTNPPVDINSTSKKTLCFQHEGKIASNATAIGIFGAALVEANKNNSDQHEKLFDKCEQMGKDIIREIHKANGGT